MNDWLIDQRGLPPTEDTVLAHRLVPKFEMRTTFDPAWVALAGAGAVTAGVATAAWGNVGLGVATAVGGMIAAAGSVRAERKLACPPPLSTLYPDWKTLTAAVASSACKLERQHLYMGTFHGLPYDVPNLISPVLAKSHMLVVGPTRSAKTQRVVMPFCLQVVARRDASVILIDGKGCVEAVHILRDAAERAGLPFLLFSLDPRLAGNLFCLFRDGAWQALTPVEQEQVLSWTFALALGEEHGVGYFSTMNRSPLGGVLDLFPDIDSFRRIDERLSDPGVRKRLGITKRNFEAASHLMACLKDMGRVPQADARPDDGIPESYFEHAVSIERALTEPCVLYCYLPALLNQTGARYLARLVIYLLVARSRTLGRDHPQVYCVCEESQTYMQANMRTPLVQARDNGVSFVLTMQNASDLKMREDDLRDAFLNSTCVKFALATRDDTGKDYFSRLSGERRDTLGATTSSRAETPTGQVDSLAAQQREVVVPRIGANEFEVVNTNHELALFDASPSEDFTRLKHTTIVNLPFPMTKGEFERFEKMAWPEPVPGETIRGSDIQRRRPEPPPVVVRLTVAPPTVEPPPSPTPSVPTPPAPTPPPPPPAPATKKHRRKPPTPEQAARSAAAAEHLRKLADEL